MRGRFPGGRADRNAAEGARKGHWDAFPVDPDRYYRSFCRNVQVEDDISERRSFSAVRRIEERLESLDKAGLAIGERLAPYRAFHTASLELADRVDGGVPVRDQRGVHLANAVERSAAVLDDVLVTEVQVSSEIGGLRSAFAGAGSGVGRVQAVVILSGMTHLVGAKGQVVIPKVLRERLGIGPGDEVEFSLDEGSDAVRLEPVRDHSTLRGSLAGLGLVAELEADHRSEARR